jgi:hypothetical protein
LVFGKWKLLTPISNQQEFKAIFKNFQNQLILELAFNNVLGIFNHFGEFLTSNVFEVCSTKPIRMDKFIERDELVEICCGQNP